MEKTQNRIAVLISGQPRHIDYCSSSIKEYFSLEGFKFDYFIHSWANCYSRREDVVRTQDFDKKYIEKKIIDVYQPKNIIVEDEKENKRLKEDMRSISKLKGGKKTTSNDFTLGLTYSLQKSFSLVKNEIKNYQMIVKIRHDMLFDTHTKEDKMLFVGCKEKDTIYTPSSETPCELFLKDIMFYSNPETFNLIFSDIYDYHVGNFIKNLKKQEPLTYRKKTFDNRHKDKLQFEGISYSSARRARDESIAVQKINFKQKTTLFRESHITKK